MKKLFGFFLLISFSALAHPTGSWFGVLEEDRISYDDLGNTISEKTVCDKHVQLTTKSLTHYTDNCDGGIRVEASEVTFEISDSKIILDGEVVGHIDDQTAVMEDISSGYKYTEKYLFKPDGSIEHTTHELISEDGYVHQEMLGECDLKPLSMSNSGLHNLSLKK